MESTVVARFYLKWWSRWLEEESAIFIARVVSVFEFTEKLIVEAMETELSV